MNDLSDKPQALRGPDEGLWFGDRGRLDQPELLDLEAALHKPESPARSLRRAGLARDLKRGHQGLCSQLEDEGAVSVRRAASRRRFEAQR